MANTRLSIILITLFFSFGCRETPEISVIPQITFSKIFFEDGSNSGNQDKLILKINFTDGDGNLGLVNETTPPFNEYNFVYDSDNNLIPFGSSDTLPPFNCINWQVIPSDFDTTEFESISTGDTVLIEINDNFYNIEIDFFTKENGVYTEFDWREEVCITYDGRFPYLNDVDKPKPIEGTLSYEMESFGFRTLFNNDTLQLRMRIRDRQLNLSNWESTPDFTLNDILVSP